jgi:hypothetical protein
MAIQIPKVQRDAPLAPTSEGRIDLSLPDVTKPSQQIDASLEHVSHAVTDGLLDAEDQAVKLKSTSEANDFERKILIDTQKIKDVQGDPTQLAAELDSKVNDYKQEILNRNKDGSDKLKRTLEAEMNDRYVKSRTARDVLLEQKHSEFDNETTKGAIELRKNGMLSNAELVGTDPSALAKIDEQVQNIHDLNYQYGKRNGLIVKTIDPDTGQPVDKFSPQLQAKNQKDVSEGLKNTIEALNNSGKVKEAKALLDKYSDIINPKDQAGLLKSNDLNSIKNDALVLSKQVETLPPDVALAKIKQYGKADDPRSIEVQQKASEFLDATRRRVENARKDRENQSFEAAAKYVESKGFTDSTDMKNDDTFQKLTVNTSAKQRQALKKMVDAPPESDPEQLRKISQDFVDGKFKGMSAADLQMELGDLSRSDRVRYRTKWESENHLTDVQKSTMHKNMTATLTQELERQNYIKRPNSKGGFDLRNQHKINEAIKQLDKDVESFPPGAIGFEQQQKYVKQSVAKFLAGEPFTGLASDNTATKFQSVATPAPSQTPAPSPATRPPTQAEINDMMTLWHKTKGRPFDKKQGDTAAAVQQLWESKGKK